MSIFEYDQEEHLRMEREESEAIGREIGEEKKARAMSIRLNKMGLSLENIAQAAEVSIDVVKQWLSAEGISVSQ